MSAKPKTTAPRPKSDFHFALGRWKRSFRAAVKSLWLHRLRSLLTVMGIVFGVCSVIAMLAIGEGASAEAQEQIKNLGSQNIILKSVKPPEEQKVSSGRQNFVLDYGLTQLDLQRIQSTIPGISIVVPARIIRDYVWHATRRVKSDICGTVTSYPAMRNQSVAQGRFFSERELAMNANVCVISDDMAKILFPIEQAIGNDVRVGADYYRVIGIMEPLARAKNDPVESSAAASSVQQMFTPISTTKSHFGEVLLKRSSGSFEAERVELHEITVKVSDSEQVVRTSQAIEDLLKRNHPKKDWDITVPLKLLKSAEHTKQIFNIVLGSIAAISLLVGGIGIMNIMLANVTERTREIGIRRALGARKRDIITQFLVESVMLSGTGGLIGVLLGIALPFLVTYFADMKTIITFWSPMLAFTISALVGIVFGIYPAMRAANMDPVEALRHN